LEFFAINGMLKKPHELIWNILAVLCRNV